MPISGTSAELLPAISSFLSESIRARNAGSDARPETACLELPVVTGPTASGKTDLCLEIAARFAGTASLSVVSADAFQVFKGMDIGTAKPSRELRARLPHHCIDIVEPTDYFSAGTYARVAEQILANLLKSGQIPIICGGSGLYLSALIDGLAASPGPDPVLRSAGLSREELLERLFALDAAAADELKAGPIHRIIRAIEIVSGTGYALSVWRRASRPRPAFRYRIFALTPPREMLYDSINRRVDAMMLAGFVDEVRGLRDRGIGPSLQSQRAIGYRELHRFLDGELELTSATELTKRNSRRLAKRQMTWIRGKNV